jgi:hypothetical protein
MHRAKNIVSTASEHGSVNRPLLSLTDLAVSNCVPEIARKDPCTPSEKFSVKELPIVFWISTHSDESLQGQDFDISIQIRDRSDKPLAKLTGSSTIVLRDQQDFIKKTTEIPPDLGSIQPGYYKMHGLVSTTQGAHRSKKTIDIEVVP